MKVLVVGDTPSRLNRDPNVAFEGAACYPRLLYWLQEMGVKDFVLLNSDTPERMRVIKAWQGPIIALGRYAQSRLTNAKIPYFPLPHPSGLNRQVNNSEYIRGQLDQIRTFVEQH